MMEHASLRLRELKFAPGESTMEFSGYGAAFNNIDAYGDVIEPGAFGAFLSDVRAEKADWPQMLSQHGGWGVTAEDMTPIGVWTDISEDGYGLRVTGKLADTPRGHEMYRLMKMTPRPAINGLSIGYITKEWTPRSKPEEPRRRIKRIDLVEISIVSSPANGRARVSDVKGLIDEFESMRDVEEFLSERGLSKKQSMALISQIKRFTVGSGDPVGDEQQKGRPGDPAADELVAMLRKQLPLLSYA